MAGALIFMPERSTTKTPLKGNAMAWTTPVLVEICVGLEINGYLPAEF
jgi:coenzyme PQQ precursor peptide PqqA